MGKGMKEGRIPLRKRPKKTGSLDVGNRAKGSRLKSNIRVSPKIKEKLGRVRSLIWDTEVPLLCGSGSLVSVTCGQPQISLPAVYH